MIAQAMRAILFANATDTSANDFLKLLWNQFPLSEAHDRIDPKTIDKPQSVNLLRHIGFFRFAPLVSSVYGWNTVAELDILVLRPSEPGDLFNHGGDIDNRLKTLFDALRIPSEPEIPEIDVGESDENPFFVLLEDDALVTGFSVATDRLLTTSESKNYVEIVVHVTVKKTRASMVNLFI
jgi:hypothetical protein